jgi:SAM-dependent methyltransferase
LIRLSQSLEVCLQSEQHWKVGPILSDAIETRIKVLSNVMEQNVQVLRDFLLKNEMKVTFMLPARPWSTHFQPTWQSTPFSTSSSSSAYTSMTQLMAHLVRDWSNEGEAVRQSVYGWCLQQLSCPNDNKLRILVPGAGLARLAWDLACQGHAVEANEVSLPMAVLAHQILHSPKTVRVYPFLTDGWVNEANSELRYQPMDIHPPDWSVPVHLSYTVGDFLEVYGSATNPSSFDVVLTVFFLDTAPNILDYLILIFNLLKPGGKWIHVGPLQWHMEAQIYPAANELERVIQSLGFHIQHWSIDDTAMDYRLQEHTTRRSTKFEGYHPLRMVAVKETVGKQEYRPN